MSRAGWPGRCGDHLLVGRGRRAASARCRCVSSCAEGTRGRVVELLPVDQGASLAFSRELLAEVVGATRLADVGLHFDSLAPETADPTWALIREAVTRGA